MKGIDIFLYVIISLLVFMLGLLLWTAIFGAPCWTIGGFSTNTTEVRAAMVRCGI